MRNVFYAITLIVMTCSSISMAKVFRNAYVAFELADNWDCSLETTEWVCRSRDEKSTKEAIIILTAKEVGPTDSFAIYEQTINSVRDVPSRTGAKVPSKVVSKAKVEQYNDQKWVDGMQLGSEIPNYFTRYVATIKDKIAILVTFSAHRQYYSKYSSDFIKAIMSLRVIATKGLIAGNQGGYGTGGTGEQIGAGFDPSSNPTNWSSNLPDAKTSKANKKLTFLLLGLGILIAGVGAWLYFGASKKSKTKKR
jgi:hypothetical protein